MGWKHSPRRDALGRCRQIATLERNEPLSSTVSSDDVLDALEAEAIHVYREVAGAFRKPIRPTDSPTAAPATPAPTIGHEIDPPNDRNNCT